ncbi:hypothetical protein [Acidisoma sp. 7E03]
MRYYDLTLLNADGSAAVRSDGSAYRWGTNVNGTYDPAALDIQFDLIISSYAAPVGGYGITIYGPALRDLQQSQNFMGTKYGNGYQFVLKGGFSAGLPLNNASQAGVIARGIIVQSFGNWRGTEMTLDFVVNPSTYTQANPGNLMLTCRAGQTLSNALQQTLSTAYPNYQINIQISDQVKWGHDVIGPYTTLEGLATGVYNITHGMLGSGYAGVSISVENNTINVFDGTVPSQKVIQLAYTDFIGQPTWIDQNTMQLFCAMRADLPLGAIIKMPIGTNMAPGLTNAPGFVTTTANSAPNELNYPLTFQGQFQVNQIRQIGHLRDPSAEGWQTVVTCTPWKAAK